MISKNIIQICGKHCFSNF